MVDITTLDIDLHEKATFIKMDIESAELAAIWGAKNHIAQDGPHLAICLYHTIKDIWKIPKLINRINPDYQFYMRYHSTKERLIPEEFVLYARHMEGGVENKVLEAQVLEALETLEEVMNYVVANLKTKAGKQKNMLDIWHSIPILLEKIISSLPEGMEQVQQLYESCVIDVKDGRDTFEKGDINKTQEIFDTRIFLSIERLHETIVLHFR